MELAFTGRNATKYSIVPMVRMNWIAMYAVQVSSSVPMANASMNFCGVTRGSIAKMVPMRENAVCSSSFGVLSQEIQIRHSSKWIMVDLYAHKLICSGIRGKKYSSVQHLVS